jgi:hypothetical protein
MTDDLWSAFSSRVSVEGALRARCEPLDPMPDRPALARLAERNLATLASIAAIEERRVESADDDNPVLQELARLDAKLNALVDIVNRLLAAPESLPVRNRLQFNALGALVPAALVPEADLVMLALHFDACPSLPLELPSRVLRGPAEGRIFLAFEPCSEALGEALERLVFRHHRRKVAETRQSLT